MAGISRNRPISTSTITCYYEKARKVVMVRVENVKNRFFFGQKTKSQKKDFWQKFTRRWSNLWAPKKNLSQ
jgi:hypothetical protein